MADPNAYWAQFIGLLDIDGVKNDEISTAARGLKVALAHYMTLRFDTEDIRYLVDIINAQGVIDAVVTNLGHISADDVAIKAAVDVVVPAPEPLPAP